MDRRHPRRSRHAIGAVPRTLARGAMAAGFKEVAGRHASCRAALPGVHAAVLRQTVASEVTGQSAATQKYGGSVAMHVLQQNLKE